MRVLFFAQLKDATGCDSIEIAMSSPLDANQFWTILLEKFPGLSPYRGQIRLSRNWEYAAPEMRFSDADEVALIPPVSGG